MTEQTPSPLDTLVQTLHLTICWMGKRLERGALGLPTSQPPSKAKPERERERQCAPARGEGRTSSLDCAEEERGTSQHKQGDNVTLMQAQQHLQNRQSNKPELRPPQGTYKAPTTTTTTAAQQQPHRSRHRTCQSRQWSASPDSGESPAAACAAKRSGASGKHRSSNNGSHTSAVQRAQHPNPGGHA